MTAQIIPLRSRVRFPAALHPSRAEARLLRADGLSFRAIGAQIGITSNVAYALAHDVEPAPRLRLVEAPRERTHADEIAAADRRAKELGGGVASCVCGHVEYFHRRGGKGSCACGGCGEWFEAGC